MQHTFHEKYHDTRIQAHLTQNIRIDDRKIHQIYCLYLTTLYAALANDEHISISSMQYRRPDYRAVSTHQGKIHHSHNSPKFDL